VDILRSVLATYGLSALLLTAIAWARTAPRHSRAVRLYLDIELIATFTLEAMHHIIGWEHRLYTVAFDGFMALIFLAFAGVIWDSRNSLASR